MIEREIEEEEEKTPPNNFLRRESLSEIWETMSVRMSVIIILLFLKMELETETSVELLRILVIELRKKMKKIVFWSLIPKSLLILLKMLIKRGSIIEEEKEEMGKRDKSRIELIEMDLK